MTKRHSSPAGAPCWADLWTADVESSRSFYSALLGWEAGEPSPQFGGYFMFMREGEPVAGAMGPMPGMPADNSWKPYFCARDIDTALKNATAGGAEVQGAAMPVGDLGVQALVRDPAGALFGLWQPGTFEGFGVVGEPSSPSWFELHTREHANEVAFYRELLGLEFEAVGDSEEFRYFTFKGQDSGENLGGIMDSRRSLGEGGDHWDIYWQVEDASATAERVAELGGAVIHGPDHTPYGVLALCSDPAGAQFKLRQSI